MRTTILLLLAGLVPLAAATPATLPPLEPRRTRLTKEQLQRREFLPCVQAYDVSTTPYQRVATFGKGSGKEQIPFTTSRTNSTEAYWDEAQSDNLQYHYHPEAIVYPRDVAQVSHIVTCAAKNGNIAVSARSGGHSFSGYGSGGQDGAVIVDLKHIADIQLNSQQGWADVGPGARLGDVVKAMWHDGKRAMPHGTCAAVGIGGHALCGGFGPSSRKWGMTIDSIVEADVVLADGSVVTTNKQSNPELLWALKGAGHFFGIVTRFRFETKDASSPMTFLEYKWTKSLTGPSDLVKIINAIQKWVSAPDFPAEIGFHTQLGPASRLDIPAGWNPTKEQFTFHLRGMALNPSDKYKPWSDKLHDLLVAQDALEPDFWAEKQVDWFQLQEMWDDFGSPGKKLDTVSEHAIHNKFVAKTVVSSDHRKPFTQAALEESMHFIWDTMVELFHVPKQWSWNVYLEMMGGSNAKYRDDKTLVQDSSFPHRDALWLIQASVGTSARGLLDARAHKVIADLDRVFTKAVHDSGSKPVSYGCYTDGDKTRDGSWKEDYYGSSVARLEKLKHEIDPINLFRNPQTFGPALGAQGQGQNKLNGDGQHVISLAHPLP